jgi:DNA-binding FadR family transcriptional regulator
MSGSSETSARGRLFTITPARATVVGETLRNRRAYEQVSIAIEQLINAGTLKPGEKLPPENDLARQFGVSRPTIREAVVALETAGLVEVKWGDATYIRERRLGDLHLRWTALDALSTGPLEQLETSALIEGELAALAATQRATSAAIAAVLDGGAAIDPKFPASITRAFHLAVIDASGNRLLGSMASALWSMRSDRAWFGRWRRLGVLDADSPLSDERRVLSEAIRSFEPQEARRTMNRLHERMRVLLFDEEIH